jgi:hypothetical protein
MCIRADSLNKLRLRFLAHRCILLIDTGKNLRFTSGRAPDDHEIHIL